jgi:pimeloyl-ACP methyl ester carboxylesterase
LSTLAHAATGRRHDNAAAGDLDLVLVPGFISHLEYDWEEPRHAAFLERLGTFARLIRLDKRGTGLSDRHGGIADLETRMDDIRAVMDAVGSESAAVFGYFEGGPLAVLFAATYPRRVRALVPFGTCAKFCAKFWLPNLTVDERQAQLEDVVGRWGDGSTVSFFAPDADDVLRAWWGSRGVSAEVPARSVT